MQSDQNAVADTGDTKKRFQVFPKGGHEQPMLASFDTLEEAIAHIQRNRLDSKHRVREWGRKRVWPTDH